MQDILRVDWAQEISLTSPPDQAHLQYSYQITSPLLYKIESYAGTSKRIVIMVQKEVAQRPYCPIHPTKDYGLLTLRLKLQFDTTLLKWWAGNALIRLPGRFGNHHAYSQS